MIQGSSRNWLSELIAPLVISLLGGGLSMYVAYRVLEERMVNTDAKVREQAAAIENVRVTAENNRRSIDDKFDTMRTLNDTRFEALRTELTRIGVDTAYMRGVIESARKEKP